MIKETGITVKLIKCDSCNESLCNENGLVFEQSTNCNATTELIDAAKKARWLVGDTIETADICLCTKCKEAVLLYYTATNTNDISGKEPSNTAPWRDTNIIEGTKTFSLSQRSV